MVVDAMRISRIMTMTTEPQTKRERLLALLQTGRRLSKIDILCEVGIWNSGDVIMKLRRGGHPEIVTEMVTEGDETFARYYIPLEHKGAS